MDKVSLLDIMCGKTNLNYLCDDLLVENNYIKFGVVIFAKGARYSFHNAFMAIPGMLIENGVYADILKDKIFIIDKF